MIRRLTEQVERAMQELQGRLPAGAIVEPPVFRQANFVRTSVNNVSRAMAIGSVLVILVLVSFLRYGRLTVISLTAIPLSIVTALGVLTTLGASINGMTLGGLAIAVGEVVDDAIVDVENVWRRLRDNARQADPQPPLEIVRAASREIRGSVVYATIIVGLVLVPVLLLGGIAGRIFSPLAQAYILAISASLLVALTVTPAMCAWLLPPLATTDAELSRVARWLLERYRLVLHWVVDRPRLVFTSSGIAAALAVVAVRFWAADSCRSSMRSRPSRTRAPCPGRLCPKRCGWPPASTCRFGHLLSPTRKPPPAARNWAKTPSR